uniref:SAM domain-containing protein n=1 Tax=Araucaria cunninghamii TaxID=56994 RepID=A0A0D6R893_ARACU
MGDWYTLSAAPPTSGGSLDMGISINSKRQRRPSVRLGEIGEQSSESYRRKKEKWDEKQWKSVQEDSKGSLLQLPWGFSKLSTEFVASGGLGYGNRMSKTQHSVDENHQGQIRSAIEVQKHENTNPLSPREEHQTVLLEGVMGVPNKKMQVDFGAASKKARHGNRRRIGSRISSAVGKGVKCIKGNPETNDENEKGSGEDGLGEPLSNASYDIYTPEGFRHSDLETSDSPGDLKETCLALQVPSLEGRSLNMGSTHGHQTVKEVFQNDELISVQRGQGKSGETWAVTNAELTRPMQDTSALLIRELGGETDMKTIPNSARHGASPRSGVKAWLNGLGLGRYAQIFEMHEVDMDVLYLLTFDDLKEMGINAVGSRRKMYNSIQQLGKGFAG